MAKLDKRTTTTPIKIPAAQPSKPLNRDWADRATYRALTGSGGDGGGFSDLDGFTGEGLDEDINEPPPWAVEQPSGARKKKS